MTINIDEGLLKEAMAAAGTTSKTAAIDFALREMARRSELKKLAAEGLGLTAGELKEVFDPASIIEETAPTPVSTNYGNKSRPRR